MARTASINVPTSLFDVFYGVLMPRCVAERLCYVAERLSFVDERMHSLNIVSYSLLNGHYSSPESDYPLDCSEIRLIDLIKRVIRPF